MIRLNKTGQLATAVATLAVSGIAQAEFGGMMNGRSADISRSAEQSIEVGVVLDDDDYQNLGGRFNYKVNPELVVYIDIGKTDPAIGEDGLGYGVGGFFQLKDTFSMPTVDFGIHASVHQIKVDDVERVDETYNEADQLIDVSTSNVDVSITSYLLEAHFSGKEAIDANGKIFWNASAGVTKVGGDLSDTELSLGGGLTMATASQSGEFYGSAFYIDGLGAGVGYRHFLK